MPCSLGLWREEDHPDTIFSVWRELNPQSLTLSTKELVRHLDQDSCAVASFRVAAGCSAVAQVNEHLQAFLNCLVRLSALYVGDYSDTTGIMLLFRRI